MAISYSEALALAQSISLTKQCGQHVNFRFKQVVDGGKGIVEGYFYVSDWYDVDSTVYSFNNGVSL